MSLNWRSCRGHRTSAQWITHGLCGPRSIASITGRKKRQRGSAQIRACSDPSVRRGLATVFLTTPTFPELERRLRHRATDSEETIQRRLRNASEEMSHWREYEYAILSGTAEEDVNSFRAIVGAERLLLPFGPTG